MPVQVHQFPCLEDNYGFLVRDEASGLVAAIDTPDADAILRELDRMRWSLAMILNTHRHGDHVGGNAALRARTGAEVIGPAEVSGPAAPDRIVAHGETVQLGETVFSVIDTGGHTTGHVSYHAGEAGIVFVGDTLFALGCGRLFEGTPGQMWESLQRLAGLPGDTLVYCAHEYTEANARFALSVDDGPELKIRAEHVFAMRQRGEPTVPTTIAEEQATNPFLRAPLLRKDADAVTAFAAIRAAKDVFVG